MLRRVEARGGERQGGARGGQRAAVALRNPGVGRSDDLRLNQVALDAVARWIWKPGLQDGKPVVVEFTTQVRFSVTP